VPDERPTVVQRRTRFELSDGRIVRLLVIEDLRERRSPGSFVWKELETIGPEAYPGR
jgi:hypothetical protein